MQVEIPENIPLSDLLGIMIQGSVLVLVIVFIFVGLRLLKILGTANQIAESISDITETVNLVLWQPIRFYSSAIDTVRKFFGKKKW